MSSRGRNSSNCVADFEEALLAPVHQVHLVDRDDEVRDAQQRGDGRCGGGFAR